MKIETKYNVGDNVWVIDYFNFKPEIVEREILDIKIKIYGKEEIDITYNIWKTNKKYDEKSVFATKQQLINSL
jgi:hypothetical protein